MVNNGSGWGLDDRTRRQERPALYLSNVEGKLPVKVLIADDDRLVRTMLGDLLAELGHVVVSAQDGAEAVRLCDREPPDLLILDFLMPRLSGLDALREIRKRHGIPALLITAINEGSLRGVDGVDQVQGRLEKPFTRKSVEAAIGKAVGGR
jgi:CheY-like chemotaxis protein